MKMSKSFIFIIFFNIILSEDNYYIKIGNKEFPFILKDTAASNELKAKLPFKVEMTKLNGNEIFYKFNNSFTTNIKSVGTINTGDIYLYQTDYLVLFYKTFSTSYSYSEIGKLTNIEGLEDAIGSDSKVTVEWCLNNSNIKSSETDDTDENIDKFTNGTNNYGIFIKFKHIVYISLLFFII